MATKKTPSPRFTLDLVDWKSIGIGAVMAIGGALATYLLEILPRLDFGLYTPVVVAILGILLNTVRKFLSGK